MIGFIEKIIKDLDKSQWRYFYFTTPADKSHGYKFFNERCKIKMGQNFKAYIIEALSLQWASGKAPLFALMFNTGFNHVLLGPLRQDLSNFHIGYLDVLFVNSDFLPETNKTMLKEGLDTYRYHNVVLDEDILNAHGMPKSFLKFILDEKEAHYSKRGVSFCSFQHIVDAYISNNKRDYSESIINDRYYSSSMFIKTSPNFKHYEQMGCMNLNGPLIPLTSTIEYEILLGRFSGYTTKAFKDRFKERTYKFETLNQVFISMYAAYVSKDIKNLPYLFIRSNTFYNLFDECAQIEEGAKNFLPTASIIVADDDTKGKLRYSPKTSKNSYKVDNLDYYFTII